MRFKHAVIVILLFVATTGSIRSQTPTTTEPQLKRIRDGLQAKLDQLRTAYGLPGATMGSIVISRALKNKVTEPLL